MLDLLCDSIVFMINEKELDDISDCILCLLSKFKFVGQGRFTFAIVNFSLINHNSLGSA